MNPISARLLSQQLISPQSNSPHDVVAHMGAMQAQDYKGMRWAVSMRTGHPSQKAFEKDYNDGKIVRTHLFRSTWHLVAAEDYRWMIDLCREKACTGIRGWARQSGLIFTRDEELVFQEYISVAFKGRGSLTRKEMEAILRDGSSWSDPGTIKYLTIIAEVSGILCSGSLTAVERTYALASERIPAGPSKSKEEALEELARRYFRSHSPATLEDFTWWSGLNIGECRSGIESIRSELSEERWKGVTFYIHTDCRTRGFRSGTVHLLPAYDEYLIGYKSRHISLHPDHRHHAHDQKGIFWPVVLMDGEVVGNWSVEKGGVVTDIFHESSVLDEDSLKSESARYLKFLNR